MLKYLYSKIVFSEIPDEITLAIAISGCQIHCNGCHSPELWEDKGIDLTLDELDRLIKKNDGITCLLLMGGERDIDYLTFLFGNLWRRIKTAWYCGLDKIPDDKVEILDYLDYVKLGHYDKNLGGLASPTTNQRLYKIELSPEGTHLKDITKELQK